MEQVLIRFRLVGDEAQALRALSVQEMRHPRDQTRYILRQELERRGLLPVPADQRQNDADDRQGVQYGD